MRIRTVTGIVAGTAALAGFVITAPYVPDAQAAVRAPAASCASQVRAVNAAERGEIGARGLDRAGLPELAAAARAATTLTGARWYGIALQATSVALGSCRRAA